MTYNQWILCHFSIIQFNNTDIIIVMNLTLRVVVKKMSGAMHNLINVAPTDTRSRRERERERVGGGEIECKSRRVKEWMCVCEGERKRLTLSEREDTHAITKERGKKNLRNRKRKYERRKSAKKKKPNRLTATFERGRERLRVGERQSARGGDRERAKQEQRERTSERVSKK